MQRRPAGLHAWDCWVRDWERLPWTEEWLAAGEARDWLSGVGSGDLPPLIEARRRAARYLLAAAGREIPGRRRDLLTPRGRPTRGWRTSWRRTPAACSGTSAWSRGEADGTRIDPARAKVRLRAARSLERQALQALSDLLGRGPIPPPAEDPLRDRDRGVRLFTWRSSYAGGIYEIHYDNAEGLRYTWLHGREAEQVTTEVHAPVPEEGGWRFALETEGSGYYEIRQTPSAENGWTTVVRTTTSAGAGFQTRSRSPSGPCPPRRPRRRKRKSRS